MRLIDLIIGILFVLCTIVLGIIILPLQLIPTTLMVVLCMIVFVLLAVYVAVTYLAKNQLIHMIRRSLTIFCSCLLAISSIALLEFDHTISNMTSIDKDSINIRLVALKQETDELQAYENKMIGLYPSDYSYQQVFLEYLKKEKQMTVRTKSYLDDEQAYQALIDKDIKGLLMTSTTYDALQKKHQIKQHVRLVFEYTTDIPKEIDLISTPFHILITGIDQVGTANKRARSDANMIASVNLNTKQVLFTSIPRDAYVDNLCLQNKKDKLTHISTKGNQCSIDSLQHLLDIPIDYYVKVSFTSLIDFIDAIGGIEINVPMKFCEYDETKKNVLHINQGNQVLTGKQALAFARHRYTLYRGDLGRNQNQQMLLNALLKKTTSPKLLANIDQVLDIASKTIQTNLTTNQIYSLLRFQLEDRRPYLLSNQSITGFASDEITASLPFQKLSVILLQEASLTSAIKEMKGLMQGISLREFSYSTNLKPKLPTLSETQGAKGTNQCHIRS